MLEGNIKIFIEFILNVLIAFEQYYLLCQILNFQKLFVSDL